MKTNERRQGALYAIASASSALLFFLPFKATSGRLNALSFVAIVYLIGAAFNLLFIFFRYRKLRLNYSTVKVGIVFGFFSALGNYSAGRSLAETLTGVTILLMRTQVFIVVLLAFLILKERIGRSYLPGLILVSIGFIILNFDAIKQLQKPQPAYLWGVLAALCFASMNVYLKKNIQTIYLNEMNVIRLLFGTSIFFLLPDTYKQIAMMPKSFWYFVLIAGFFGPGLSRNLQLQALRRLEASRVVLFSMLTPILAFLFEIFFQNTKADSKLVLGSCIISLGLLIPIVSEIMKERRNQQV